MLVRGNGDPIARGRSTFRRDSRVTFCDGWRMNLDLWKERIAWMLIGMSLMGAPWAFSEAIRTATMKWKMGLHPEREIK